MEVVYAENGRAGIEIFQNTPGIHGVLMDVMMRNRMVANDPGYPGA